MLDSKGQKHPFPQQCPKPPATDIILWFLSYLCFPLFLPLPALPPLLPLLQGLQVILLQSRDRETAIIVLINKVLLKHSCTHLFPFCLRWLSCSTQLKNCNREHPRLYNTTRSLQKSLMTLVLESYQRMSCEKLSYATERVYSLCFTFFWQRIWKRLIFTAILKQSKPI